jgi:clan AA aspartic protease
MGTIYANITVANQQDVFLARAGMITEEQVRKKKVRAMVDTGAYISVIPQSLFDELGLEREDYEVARYADGRTEKVVLASSVAFLFENRKAIINPIVLGDEVLIGATTLQLLDVVLDPVQEKMSVNPASPEMGMYRV